MPPTSPSAISVYPAAPASVLTVHSPAASDIFAFSSVITTSIAALFLYLVMVSCALAQEVPESALMTMMPSRRGPPTGSIEIRVRTIQAFDHISAQAALDGVSVQIDPRIRELLPKLRRLQFRSFRLMNSVSERLSLLQKDVLALGNGSTLAVRPMYHEADRVGVWLKWTDGDGDTLLDTRMHFDSGDTVLAGTERSNDSGVILAIDLDPASR